MKIVPLELKDLNALVARLHRHHKPVTGHRFSIGVEHDGKVIGGICVGRPTARLTDQRRILEVTRLVTDGTANACSILYAAAARVGRELGYEKIQTFILDSEPGTSLRAAGWEFEIESGGGDWNRPSTKLRKSWLFDEYNRTDQPQGVKHRYAKKLNSRHAARQMDAPLPSGASEAQSLGAAPNQR
jgi:hypothetical protein